MRCQAVESNPRKRSKAEAAIKPGSHIAGDRGSFNDDGARAAERILQRFVWCPAGKSEKTGSKIFFQRGFAFSFAPAALKERFTRGV